MIRNLLIIAGSGLVLAIVGIGGSLALTGGDLARNNWTWVIDSDNEDFDIRRGTAPEIIERKLEWSALERLAIDIPADVTYVQSTEEAGISIRGPKSIVDKVVLNNGRLSLDGDVSNSGRGYVTWTRNGIHGWNDIDRLEITIRAPSVKHFELLGQTDLQVRDYDQPTLDLTLLGNADIEVTGHTETLSVEASGNSSADLDALLGRDATLRLHGNSDVSTSANGKVRIEASGNSSIRLTRRPEELIQQLTQTASVDQD